MTRKQTTRRAKSIIISDSAGRMRINLYAGDKYASFQLCDAQERARATIQVEPALANCHNKTPVPVPGDRALFNLQDVNGSGLVGLAANPEGSIGISIKRPGDGNIPVLQLSWSEAAGLEMSLWDHSGNPVWQGSGPVDHTGFKDL